jgi:predicted amidohydrolase
MPSPRLRVIITVIMGLILLLGAYHVWSRLDRHAARETMELRLLEVRSCGTDRGRGNILGVQPYMLPDDYASAAHFSRKLDGYLAAARAHGFIRRKTIVVLPEYLGTWLVIAGEKADVYRATTIHTALQRLVVSNLGPFLRQLPRGDARERAKAAVFQMKARAMAAIYQQVFAQLARKYQTYIVAGSIILPAPRVTHGVLSCGDGPLANVSVLYGPDGLAQAPVVRKAFPTTEERPFLQAGSVAALPVFPTPSGRLGILICADAWFPASYARLRAAHADIIVVPSYVTGNGKLAQPWKGYDGAPPPADSHPADVRHITQGHAWQKYALVARLPASGATSGMIVCLRGRLWDLGADGQTIALSGTTQYHGANRDGASLVNLWR